MADRKLTVQQLLKELEKYNHTELHVHHTWKPNHTHWRNRPDAQYWQNSMRSVHVNGNGWADIAQHVTIFPDGTILTGRNFGQSPASIKGYNRVKGGIPFMVEMVGNFDKGNDPFAGKQKEAMIEIARWFDKRGKYIRFHRENASKTCPGTGIDKNAFMAEVRQQATNITTAVSINRVLKVGSRGDDVKALQNLLNQLGFNCGKADGIFGNATKQAVMKFQRANGLQVDGIVGKNTVAKLNQTIKKKELYKVQVGAFSKKSNADNLVKELKAKGFDSFVVYVDGLYKVQTGAFSVKSNADNLVKKLQNKGYKPFVVRG